MRVLVLLRGAPGVGKSTWIKQNNLEQYTLSPDNLRLNFQTPIMALDGGMRISQNNDKKVWNLLFTVLEERMSRGELSIIDATHSSTKSITAYRNLCKQYRYRCYVVDFADIPLELALERNKGRETYKFVPENAIKMIYSRYKTQKVPSFAKLITRDEFGEVIQYTPRDLSEYKKIHFIGDIHGCFEPLKEYFKNGIKEDEFYIFLGDYTDRGLQNKEVLEWLISITKIDRPNCEQPDNLILLEGNHECISKDTEILTEEGWINSEFLYKNFEKNEIKLANFDIKNNNIYYDNFLKKHISFKHDAIEISGNNTSQLVSLDHDLIVNNEKVKAKDILGKNLNESVFTLTGNTYKSEYDIDDNIIKLLIWVIMDGTIVDHSKYNKNSTKKRIQFKLSKQRKIKELTNLLEDLNFKYTLKKCSMSEYNKMQPYYIRIYGDYARKIFSLLGGEKTIPNFFNSLSKRQFDLVLDTITITDGCKTKLGDTIHWSTTNVHDLNILQKLCIENGYVLTYNFKKTAYKNSFNKKTLYSASIKKSMFNYYKIKTNIINYEDFMYCWTMPKGTLITRRNGKVSFTGNCYTRNFANDDLENTSRSFKKYTLPEIQDLDKKILRQLYRKLAQIAYITYNDKEIICTHGGIPTIPNNLSYIATEEFIKGVGKYKDNIGEYFTNNTKDNQYCVYGHRNIQGFPTQITDRAFNLQGDIEQGGYLRVLTLDGSGFNTIEIKNNLFRQSEKKLKTTEILPSKSELVNSLRQNSKWIIEKSFGNISSFNFNRKVFYDGIWNEQTMKARGLFTNTQTNEIVARSYDKFFNIGENTANSLGELKNKLQFPVTVYLKENGYLGILGYDSESDEMLFCSKSSIEGDYAEKFKELFYKQFNEDQVKYIKETLIKDEVSLIFEVIDPMFDPHIIKYKEAKIVLLDIVKRDIKFRNFESRTYALARLLDCEVKERVKVFNNWTEFCEWYYPTIDDFSIHLEGYVLQDSIGFMTKIKLPYYKFWKKWRGFKDRMKKDRNLNGRMLNTAMDGDLYEFLKRLSDDELSQDIITLRGKFENLLVGKEI